MSRETWLAEFYPIEAEYVPVEQAVAHGLQKWIGLRKENLDKHDVVLNDMVNVTTKDGYYVLDTDSNSCALCMHYLGKYPYYCERCPLSAVRGYNACDKKMSGEEDSPWGVYTGTGNPEPMIMWLQKAKSFIETKDSNEN